MNPKKFLERPEKQNRLARLLGRPLDPDHPREVRGARRPLFVVPALLQFFVALVLIVSSLENSSTRRIDYSLALILLVGAVGILSRPRRLFLLGLVGTGLGFLLPLTIHLLATPIDKEYAYWAGLGLYDAEGVGFLMFLRLLLEFPIWLLYTIVAMIFWARRHRTTMISSQ